MQAATTPAMQSDLEWVAWFLATYFPCMAAMLLNFDLPNPGHPCAKAHTARKKMLASPLVKTTSVQKKLDFKEHVDDGDFSVPHL